MIRLFLLMLALSFLVPQEAATAPQHRGWRQIGVGSSYGWKDGFHGRRTASGERFNQWAYTAASRRGGFGTLVRVTNLKTKQSVVVRINDRGPFAKHRIIDLSTAAARRIGMDGVARVSVDVLERG